MLLLEKSDIRKRKNPHQQTELVVLTFIVSDVSVILVSTREDERIIG